VQDALRLAEKLKQSATMVIALWFGAWICYERGDRETAAVLGSRMLALATEHEISNWVGLALVLPHVVPIKQPMAAETLADLHRRLLAGAATGGTWRYSFSLCVLAELYAEAGHPMEALEVLASIPTNARGVFYAPEIRRVEGDLLLRRSEAFAADAERCFRQAIDLARSRDEKSLELRAATSLARLWQRQGKRDEAGRLIGDIYGWFTEGFATADLLSARRLLDELSAQST